MQKIFYYIVFFSSFMVQAHISHDGTHQSSISWYGVTDKKDLIVATALSTAFCGGSFLVKDKGTRTIIQTTALLVPLIRFLSTTGIVKKTLNSVPLIKEVVGCAESACEGICSQCVMRHTMLDAGIATTLVSLSAPLLESLVKRLERKKTEKEKEVLTRKKECDICAEIKEERYCSSLKCCKDKIMCGKCIDAYYKSKISDYQQDVVCPYCRGQFQCDFPEQEGLDSDTKEDAELTNDNKKNLPLTGSPFSAAFNKVLLATGGMITSCATLISYADHRGVVKDEALAIACSGLLLALTTKIKDPVKQKQLLAVALIAPFLGLINKSEMIRKIGNTVPFLNHLFGCDKEACTAICAHCKLRNAQRGTAALIGVSLLSPSLFGRS